MTNGYHESEADALWTHHKAAVMKGIMTDGKRRKAMNQKYARWNTVCHIDGRSYKEGNRSPRRVQVWWTQSTGLVVIKGYQFSHSTVWFNWIFSFQFVSYYLKCLVVPEQASFDSSTWVIVPSGAARLISSTPFFAILCLQLQSNFVWGLSPGMICCFHISESATYRN